MSFPAAKLLLAARPAAAGGFVPTDIAGCEVWFDASDADSFTYSSGSDVSQWDDLSGNGRHLTQGTGSRQPHRSGTINGVDAVVFGASDEEYMSVSCTVSQPVTIFVAVQRVGNGGGNEQIVGNVSTSSTLLVHPTNTKWAYYAGSLPQGSNVDNNPHVLTGIFNNAGTSNLLLDGSSMTTTTPGSAGINGTLRIGSDGSGNKWNGKIGEIIAYNSALGTTDRETVEDYLMTKWGL